MLLWLFFSPFFLFEVMIFFTGWNVNGTVVILYLDRWLKQLFFFFKFLVYFICCHMILPIEDLNLKELFMNESYIIYLFIYTCVTCSLLLLLIKSASRWWSKVLSSLGFILEQSVCSSKISVYLLCCSFKYVSSNLIVFQVFFNYYYYCLFYFTCKRMDGLVCYLVGMDFDEFRCEMIIFFPLYNFY